MLNFSIEKKDQLAKLIFLGRIDNEGIQSFQDALNGLLETDAGKVVLDFTKLEFINSSGIGKLLIFYKKSKNSGKETSIEGISEEIFTLFRAIRLDKLIEIKK